MQHIVLLLLFALLSSPVIATSPGTALNWAINTAPPFHIVGGVFDQKGLCDQLLSSIQKQLPNSGHRVVLMPQPRIHQALNNKQQLCFPCMIHRSQPTHTAVFSTPTHWYRPTGIITRQALAQHLTEQFGSPLHLQSLLKSETFKLGLAAGRKYAELEPLLEPYRQNALVRSGDDSPVALLKMIQSGRIDFTLDYDIILTYLNKTEPNQAKGLVYVPISELASPIAGAVGCSNSDWGRRQIELINSVLPKVQADPDFKQSLELWFDTRVLPMPSEPKAQLKQ
ncbi:TIGR02285 family protein [Rheinheimera sp.]|uniref:TIGR02285 family protein n=1 Tax=Rheinheimera sp. TaxID=1869214 RepID=UPI0026064F8F|nr:TIGR02285 family protein [Rheinheimera sp.]MCA1929526.1 TIGR02285 family protein [Rheinheimera sp.]